MPNNIVVPDDVVEIINDIIANQDKEVVEENQDREYIYIEDYADPELGSPDEKEEIIWILI